MAPARQQTSLHILLVEDNDYDWVAFQRAFKVAALFVEIEHCVRAETALAQLKEYPKQATTLPFDLLVTDHKLPGMSGLDLCLEILRAHIPIPTVLLTGAGSEHLAVEALKAGVNDYLIKDTEGGYLALLPVVLPEVVRQYHEHTARQRAELALKQQHRQLTLLNEVGQELVAMRDPQQVTAHLLTAVTTTLNAEGASLWLWSEATDEHQRQLTCQGFYNLAEHSLVCIDDLALPSGHGIASWVAEHGKSVVLRQPHDDARFYPGIDQLTGLRTRSLLAVPLWMRNNVIGVLEVVNKSDGDFMQDQTLVETLAASAAIALDNARLVKALQQRSTELQSRNEALEEALQAIKTLSGLVPICAWCGSKIQDEHGQWFSVETYIQEHSEAEFTHGICPDCLRKWKEHT